MEPIKDTFLSADGKTAVAYKIWEPAGIPVRAVVQLSHGMCEYCGRYADYAEHLAANGVVFAGNDHLGHGDTAPDDASLGYFSDADGKELLVRDLHTMTSVLKERYPGVPLFLLGHSMGSFLARLYITEYAADIDGTIIMGTGGTDSPSGMGKLLAGLVIMFRGPRYRSKMLKNIAFSGYTKRCGKGCDKNAWLTRDADIVARYNADKFCTYTFTASAYYCLFDMVGSVSTREWAESVPTDLPVLIISGGDDPIGGFGKGTSAVAALLAGAGLRDMTLNIIPGARHEVLNETDRDEVYAYLDEWLTSHLPETDGDGEE